MKKELLHVSTGLVDESKIEATTDWFASTKGPFQDAVTTYDRSRDKTKKILEIGSYEGVSTCAFVNMFPNLESITCVDSWEGGDEHKADGINMSSVEATFDKNTSSLIPDSIEVIKHQSYSFNALCDLAAKGEKFDFVYVDGSHTAYHAIEDIIISFNMLNSGGMMVIDDYLWGDYVNEVQDTPKAAFDAFANIYKGQFKLAHDANWRSQYQQYIIKL